MSEQPRRPAREPDPGRSDRDERAPESGASGASQDRPAPEGSGPDEAPRMTPRPVQRPDVDPAQSAVFGRPSGVEGSFDPSSETPPAASPPAASPPPGSQARPEPRSAPPPPESLAQAFGRPSDSGELVQRAPAERGRSGNGRGEEHFWTTGGYRDPWRDPAAGAALGPPAQPEPDRAEESPSETGPRLSAREVLFGRRVRPRSLAALAAVAVLLGLVGGFLGRITAEEGNPLTNPDVTLPRPEVGAHRPAGSVAGVAERVVPSVVSVETRVGAEGGTGSGVMIDGNGYVLTNNHVVSMAADTPTAKVSTVFQGGKRVPARVVGRDPKTDLAVIKVEVANPTVAPLGRSSDLAVGDDVVAIGSPLGLANTVTTGIVSSLHRPVRLSGEGSDTNAVIDAVQTDAAINPGNSGGALVDGNGALVGINSAIRSEGQGGSIGIGFAIPIDDARRIAEELIRTGHAQHADLGVNARSVNDGLTDGAQVQNVKDGSVAAAAGIAEGDVITRVGERGVGGADELVVAVNAHRNGEDLPVTVVRQGRELVLNARLR